LKEEWEASKGLETHMDLEARNSDCCICLESFTEEQPTILMLTPCEHLFHGNCMLTLLTTRLEVARLNRQTWMAGFDCPYCRCRISIIHSLRRDNSTLDNSIS
jgi:hypothetical protein